MVGAEGWCAVTATLIITRGLPGSGKTTRAKAWVAESPLSRARVNRDDLRAMAHGGFVRAERQITAIRDAAISALLTLGVDVVCDDTNLPGRHAQELRRLARSAGAGFEVWDLTDVDLEECIRRDADREAMVGEEVIRDMYQRFVARKPYPLPLPDDTPDADLMARHYPTEEIR
jgi:tRNA uridine 5-carbamoylmethylation protein Kti12